MDSPSSASKAHVSSIVTNPNGKLHLSYGKHRKLDLGYCEETSKLRSDAGANSDYEHERKWEQDRGCSPPPPSPSASPDAKAEATNSAEETAQKLLAAFIDPPASEEAEAPAQPEVEKPQAAQAEDRTKEDKGDKSEDDCMIIGDERISRRSRRAPEQSLKRERLLLSALGAPRDLSSRGVKRRQESGKDVSPAEAKRSRSEIRLDEERLQKRAERFKT
jgi:hypothetical protein